MGDCACAALGCSSGCCDLGGRRIAEDEELYKGGDKQYHGYLTDDETLCE